MTKEVDALRRDVNKAIRVLNDNAEILNKVSEAVAGLLYNQRLIQARLSLGGADGNNAETQTETVGQKTETEGVRKKATGQKRG